MSLVIPLSLVHLLPLISRRTVLIHLLSPRASGTDYLSYTHFQLITLCSTSLRKLRQSKENFLTLHRCGHPPTCTRDWMYSASCPVNMDQLPCHSSLVPEYIPPQPLKGNPALFAFAFLLDYSHESTNMLSFAFFLKKEAPLIPHLLSATLSLFPP